MDDKQLDALLDRARDSYRAPPAPDADALWRGIEAEAFAVRRAPSRDWGLAWRVAAASLVLGAIAGRWSARVTPVDGGVTPAAELAVSPVVQPYSETTEALLGQTAVLLAALKSSETPATLNAQLASQATQLLGTTRLLLDSPVASDPRMQSLLLDLELTLAQVARLQPSRADTDLTLINDALAERDIVPRIRSAVVDLSASAGYPE